MDMITLNQVVRIRHQEFIEWAEQHNSSPRRQRRTLISILRLIHQQMSRQVRRLNAAQSTIRENSQKA